MKFIFGIILSIIIVFFVWNILKRLFFKTFYMNFPQPQNQQRQSDPKEKLKSGKSGLKWDAETIEYEEVKEEKK